MTKRLLSILIAVILLLTALPLTTNAAKTNVSDTGMTLIQAVSATIAEPVAGQKPSYSATVPAGKGYRVSSITSGAKKNGVEWFNKTQNKNLKPDSDTIEVGNSYAVIIELELVSDAYAFDYEHATATLNGQEAEIVRFINGDSEIITMGIRYDYSIPDPNLQYITSLSVSVTKPTPGATPSFSASVPAGKGYRIKEMNESGYHHGVRWSFANSFQAMDPDNDVFVEGDDYLVELYFEPVSAAYAFDVDHITGTINGKEAAVIKYMAGDNVVGIGLRERYTCLGASGTPISGIGVSITAPAASKMPSYSTTVSASADYVAYAVTDEYYTNGVHWYNKTDHENMTATSQFEGGKEYSVIILLAPRDGYYFPETVYGTVNSNAAQCAVNYEDILEVSYTFTCTSSVTMGSVVKGNYNSFGLEAYVYPTIELLQGSTVKYTKLCGKHSGSYTFTNLGFGTYTLRISKKNHVTREYTLTCQGSFTDRQTVDLQICPIGDISGDGKITTKDYSMANAHAMKTSMLSGYPLACGDVMKNDGKITTADVSRINAAAMKTQPLW